MEADVDPAGSRPDTHHITWFAPDRPVTGGTVYTRDDSGDDPSGPSDLDG